MDLLFYIFSLHKIYSIYVSDFTNIILLKENTPKDLYKVYSKNKISKDANILILHGNYTGYENEPSHTIAILKCNNIWYLYDNNHGIFKFVFTDTYPELAINIINNSDDHKTLIPMYYYDLKGRPLFILKEFPIIEKKKENATYFYPLLYFLIGMNFMVPNQKGNGRKKTRRIRR